MTRDSHNVTASTACFEYTAAKAIEDTNKPTTQQRTPADLSYC
jgi:hypothetical protein